jgi:hypothetical protein
MYYVYMYYVQVKNIFLYAAYNDIVQMVYVWFCHKCNGIICNHPVLYYSLFRFYARYILLSTNNLCY